MTESLILILKASIFERQKTLIINPDFLAFGTMSFAKSEITGIRYGIKAIKGYRFRIGRIYCIDIENSTGAIIKLRLKSLYRVRKNKLGEKYQLILNALLKNYINAISLNFINKFFHEIEFSILGVVFNREGLILNKNIGLISWTDLGSKNYWSYYSLFSNDDPNKYRTFHYLTDWNTVVLYAVSGIF